MSKRLDSASFTLKAIYNRADRQPIELLSALLAFGWGLYLLINTRMFGNSQVYTTMESLGRERVWAIIFLIASLVQFSSVVINIIPKISITLGFMLWLIVSITFWNSNPSSVGGLVYSIFALSQAWALRRTYVGDY